LVEPLLHFAVPFASLRAIGVDFRKVMFASLVALTPDLDAIFQVHRSQSHSLIVLALVVFPLLILTRNRKTFRSLVLLGAFGVLVHLVLDLFQAPTPLLWPLLSQSLWIQTTLNFHMGSAPVITGSAGLQIEPAVFEQFTSFDAPILTAPGLGVSVVLMAPSLVQILRNRLTRSARPRPQ
jgi:hypothetical protein